MRGEVYIGQTSRCINDRLAEHKINLKNETSDSLLVRQCLYCTDYPICEHFWNETEILVKEGDGDRYLILETIRIGSKPDDVNRKTSLVFEATTKLFLGLSSMYSLRVTGFSS